MKTPEEFVGDYMEDVDCPCVVTCTLQEPCRAALRDLIAARDAEHAAALRSAMDRCGRAGRERDEVKSQRLVELADNKRKALRRKDEITRLSRTVASLRAMIRKETPLDDAVVDPTGLTRNLASRRRLLARSKANEVRIAELEIEFKMGRASRVPESSVCTVAAVDRPSSGLVPASPALSAPQPANSPAIPDSSPAPAPAEPTCATCLGTGNVGEYGPPGGPYVECPACRATGTEGR